MRVQARVLPVYDSAKFRLPLLSEARDLWRYRFLVRNLIARDLKVRYKRSVIGFIWVMLNPLLTMIVLTIVFSSIFRFNVAHYSIFLLAGILLWGAFAQGTTAAMASLSANGNTLRKLQVPASAFVVSAIGSALVNFLYALVPFLLLTVVNQLWPSTTWAFLVVPTLLLSVFSLGIGLIVSALYVYFHDTFEIYQVLLNVFYFATPVLYPIRNLPEPVRSLEQWNPLYLYMEMFRNIVMNSTLPQIDELVKAAVAAAISLIVGWVFFTRLEDQFAYHF